MIKSVFPTGGDIVQKGGFFRQFGDSFEVIELWVIAFEQLFCHRNGLLAMEDHYSALGVIPN